MANKYTNVFRAREQEHHLDEVALRKSQSKRHEHYDRHVKLKCYEMISKYSRMMCALNVK